MYEKSDFKPWLANFFLSLKGFVVVCIMLAIAFYMFVYVFAKPDFAEAEQTYNTLKEIAYTEAEKKNTDYEITDVLLKYEISTIEDGTKHITLVGKDNVNLKFYLSKDYEIIETAPSWKVSTATTIITQIFSSAVIGIFGGAVIYYLLYAIDIMITAKGCYKDKKK